METQQLRLDSIADHSDLVATIARWHWEEWGDTDAAGSLSGWAEGLRQRTNRDRIPTTYVALAGDDLLGSVTLVEHDMDTHRGWSPWLAGAYVTPSHRGQGVGSALVRHAVTEVAKMGVHRLYLYTASARGFYEQLGWRTLADEDYRGRSVTIMAIDLAPAFGDGEGAR